MSTLNFVRENRAFLAFGFSLNLFSSFGQTFFIALFGDNIRADFDLGHGGYGLVYSLATLASALSLGTVGALIDRVPLQRFSLAICLGLALACSLLSVAPNVWILGLAIYGLRLCGQGLMTHTAATALSRAYGAARGRALAFANLGHPAGNALFPIAAVALLAVDGLGWRDCWLGFSGLIAALLPLWVILLLRRSGEAAALPVIEEKGQGEAKAGVERHWTRGQVLRDPRFYMVLPALLAPGFLITGFFFHQNHLAAQKGWEMTWLASAYTGFAALMLVGSLSAGFLVDRIGAARLLPLFLWPLIGSLAALGLADNKLIAFVYMGLAGLTAGAAGTMGAAFWAEAYGLRHLGAIRALVTSLGVFSTAASPVTMGWLIDGGWTMETLALISVAYMVLAAGLAAVPRFSKIA